MERTRHETETAHTDNKTADSRQHRQTVATDNRTDNKTNNKTTTTRTHPHKDTHATKIETSETAQFFSHDGYVKHRGDDCVQTRRKSL